MFLINANYVNLSGFTIKNYGVNGSSIIINSNQCIIKDNILFGEDHFNGIEYCIRVVGGEKNILSNNTIFGTDNGIELSSCKGNIIEKNKFMNNQGFIYLLKSEKHNKKYLGTTTQPSERINYHNQGLVKATKYGVPWVCLAIINVGTIKEAKKIEYYIKKQKLALTVENVVKILDWYYKKL